MNRSKLLGIGLTGVLALAASPAAAQHHREGDGGGQRHETATPRSDNHNSGERAQPRQDRQSQPSQQPQQAQRSQQGQQSQRSQQAQRPQQQNGQPRFDRQERVEPRYRASAPRYDGGRYYSGGRYYGPRYVGPRFAVAPRHFFRPYYVFRPRFSIGFGIWAGYPITYYDPYYYPYDYYSYSTSPVPPPYPPQGSVGVQPSAPPNQANMGGLSFDITPATAEVYVDGNYYGEVGTFSASTQPLGLPAGHHHVELREPGYEVTSFDVEIMPGQVIPYQGQLQP